METVQIVIRDALPEEREAAVQLSVEAYRQYEKSFGAELWENYRESMIALWREGGGVDRLVAVQDGRLSGSVLYCPPVERLYPRLDAAIPYPEIRLLAVRPSARGQGVATALIRECVRRAGQSGAPYLGLHTSYHMEAAVRLYRRLGFERAPEFDFTGGDGHTPVEAYRLPTGTGIREEYIG
ncbi:GNAT family N-acetyltransferase [Paenibacillus hamazuiensis]|uniref:GNAT family N-acetyltransferase n=1 Tax=Paenibacillus hamazuiensis TaxID=2936508 RepID=UPI00200D3DE5|nr:GNAT family N-acetyltransferase [Paenibacillus hamazuiensis]